MCPLCSSLFLNATWQVLQVYGCVEAVSPAEDRPDAGTLLAVMEAISYVGNEESLGICLFVASGDLIRAREICALRNSVGLSLYEYETLACLEMQT